MGTLGNKGGEVHVGDGFRIDKMECAIGMIEVEEQEVRL